MVDARIVDRVLTEADRAAIDFARGLGTGVTATRSTVRATFTKIVEQVSDVLSTGSIADSMTSGAATEEAALVNAYAAFAGVLLAALNSDMMNANERRMIQHGEDALVRVMDAASEGPQASDPAADRAARKKHRTSSYEVATGYEPS